ncbi:transposase [Streptomyces sp. NPDC002671]
MGVDDFARYGDTYGTLLVDATTRLPLTLWEGRDAEQLSRWLRGHPGVEVACRVGSLLYRQGIADGAPDAVQASDRFHLWQSLSRRVQDVAATHRGCLPAALLAPAGPEPAEAADADSEPMDSPAGRHARRLFEAVHALTDAGRPYATAARELGLDRRTVRKYARARTWHEVMRRAPRRPSTLDPYLDYLQQRWDEGKHNAKILHQELLGKSYLGHYQRVKMALAPLRRGLPLDEPRERPPSPREAARWIITAPDRRGPQTAERLRRPLEHCPELRHTHGLVREFAAMLDTAMPHRCRTGSDDSPTAGWRPSPASPPPCAKTNTPSLRESPPLTAPESTRAGSPT